MRLALWSPSRDRGWPAALGPLLARKTPLELVGEEPAAPPAADLHIYHVADDPTHGFVYRALLRRPGLVVLEDWGLHRLVHAETVGRGEEATYRRELRRAHGETGAFVARQVLSGRGGLLPPLLLPVNERVLESALAVVATSEAVRAAAAARLPSRPVLHLPLSFVGLAPLPERAAARQGLGLDEGSFVILALRPTHDDAPARPGARILDRLREVAPRAVVFAVGESDPTLPSQVAAADVVVALERPVYAGLGAAVPLAVAGGIPTLVSAGSGAARELPEGVVARVSPGATADAETVALVRRLLTDDSLRAGMGRVARGFAAEHEDPSRCVEPLLEVLRAADRAQTARLEAFAARRAKEGTLASGAGDEVHRAARELGVVDLPPGLAPLVAELFEEEAS
jgi:hypothetical protein